jgi:hypothetical protein
LWQRLPIFAQLIPGSVVIIIIITIIIIINPPNR